MGFIECQVRTLKTTLSTAWDSKKTKDDLLLDLWSTPIGSNMPFSWEILHNRTFQQPSKPSSPVDMESVQNFLLSRKQSQKTHIDQSHSARELEELGPSQEVLLRSPADDEYIPGTIIGKATKPHSYFMEA